MSEYEHCIECEEHTGRAGASEDSLFHGYSGPFCEDCFDDWPDNQVAQIMLLKAQIVELELAAINAIQLMHGEQAKADWHAYDASKDQEP
jgi:hypothetical protein